MRQLASEGPWPNSKCSETVEVRCLYKELKLCQHEIATDEFLEQKRIKEGSAIWKHILWYVSSLTGSVQLKLAKGKQRRLNQCCSTLFEQPQPLSHYSHEFMPFENKCLANLNQFLRRSAGVSYLDCSSQILRSGKIQENSWLQTFYRHIYDRIGHRLELNAQFALSWLSTLQK